MQLKDDEFGLVTDYENGHFKVFIKNKCGYINDKDIFSNQGISSKIQMNFYLS